MWYGFLPVQATVAASKISSELEGLDDRKHVCVSYSACNMSAKTTVAVEMPESQGCQGLEVIF